MHTISQRRGFGSYVGPKHSSAGFYSRFPGAIAARTFEILLTWQERDRQRRALAALDGRMLGDLGLSRADVERELRKPFWRA